MKENTSIREVKGVGDKTAALLKKLELHTCQDMLRFYPRDYGKSL